MGKTVSKTIAQLEERLEVKLLTSTSRGLTPTEAGVNFYERARRVIEETDEAELAALERVNEFAWKGSAFGLRLQEAKSGAAGARGIPRFEAGWPVCGIGCGVAPACSGDGRTANAYECLLTGWDSKESCETCDVCSQTRIRPLPANFDVFSGSVRMQRRDNLNSAGTSDEPASSADTRRYCMDALSAQVQASLSLSAQA